jgi:hypothetical protein
MPNKVELLIAVNDTGQVQVTGPIENKVLCYGLLAAAQDAVRDYHAIAAQRLVQPASAPLSFELPKGNGRG